MAPLIAAAIKFGFPILASALASKGGEAIQEKLGIDISSALGSEEGRIKLKQLEMEHEQFLIEAAQQSEIRDLEYFKAEIDDRESARDRDSKIAAASQKNYRADLMFGLAIAVTVGLVYLVWRSEELAEFTKGIVTLVLGRFMGYLDNIYSFEFGTTRGSRQKDATIDKLSGEGK